MNEKAVKYGILVNSLSESTGYRTYELGISDDRIKNSHHLSCYDLEMTNEVIKSLENIINNKKGEYDWGTEQILITSESEISTLEDYMYEENLPSVNTSLLLDFMMYWKAFQEKYNKEKASKDIIKKAYKAIFHERKKYSFGKRKIDYVVYLDEVRIHLILDKSRGDFKLNPDEYASQIKRIVW